MRTIKTFADGTSLEYGQGSFDSWCVYIKNNDGEKVAPRDVDYFEKIRKLALKYGVKKIYDDFLAIYNQTNSIINVDILNYISEISREYKEDNIIIDKIFTILYMGMIAEEKKKNTRLGKRIKRLGIYKLLIEECDVEEAANCMRGMKWYEIDRICKAAGF